MDIRPATLDDLDALVHLNQQIGVYHHDHDPTTFLPPSNEDREFLRSALISDNRHFLVAELDGQVAGFLTASILKNESVPFLSKQPICKVGTVVVHEEYRSQGIGRALMSACEAWARTRGAAELQLEVMEFNADAQRLYAELGFDTKSRIMAKPVN